MAAAAAAAAADGGDGFQDAVQNRRGPVPNNVKDCPEGDKMRLTYFRWRSDVDRWVNTMNKVGMGPSVIASSIFCVLDEDDKDTCW